MRLRLTLQFLVSAFFLSSIFCQEGESQSSEDSLSRVRRENYEQRLKAIEELRRRRDKDPKRWADSVAQVREKQKYAKAQERIEDYKLFGVSNLKEIDLSDARLTKVPDWVFKATKLEILVLDNNRISKIPREFIGLDSLKRIYWRNNDLGRTKVKIPKLMKIEKLDLTGNSITKLPRLQKLKGLEELILENNKFDKIPTLRGRRLKNLKELDLSLNPIKINRRWYGLLDHIEILKLNKCEISELDPSMFKMQGLKELQIQVNMIEEIPDAISDLRKLEKLSFYKNKLKELPTDFFTLDSLQVIDLYYNQFEKIPKEIGKLKNLEILYFSFNELYDIPDEIGMLINLKELYIHHNRISELPTSLKNLSELKILHFQNNYISEFPMQILDMQSIVDLDISNTDITAIPEDITGMKLENFYWRDLDIDLNSSRDHQIGTTLLKLSEQGTNVFPYISTQSTSSN